jgi:hypothetical protein
MSLQTPSDTWHLNYIDNTFRIMTHQVEYGNVGHIL